MIPAVLWYLAAAAVAAATVAVLAVKVCTGSEAGDDDEPELRNALEEALERARELIRSGDPALGVPVLDPFQSRLVPVSVSQPPALTLEGQLERVKVTGLGEFAVEQATIKIGLLPPRATVTLQLRLPLVDARGEYSLEGDFNASLHVFGQGPFRAQIIDATFQAVVVVNALTSRVSSIAVTLGLGDLKLAAEGLQGGGELGDQLNAEAERRLLSWFASSRPQLEAQLAAVLKQLIEQQLRGNRRWQELMSPVIQRH